jgi:hypothetical protein
MNQRYQLAATIECSAETVALLIHEDGQISSCKFRSLITIPTGKYCKIIRCSDGSRAFVPIK